MCRQSPDVELPTGPEIMERRNYLKTIGGLGVVGALGLGATGIGSAQAGSTLNVQSQNLGTITNDDGNITEVYVKPRLRIQWNGFDEVVERARILVEARLEQGPGGVVLPAWESEIDGLRNDIYQALGNDYGQYPLLQDSYVPVFRETPWLYNDEFYPEKLTNEGTSGVFPEGGGRFPLFSRASERTSRTGDYFKSEPPANEIPPIVLFSDTDPRPDYAGLPGSDPDINETPGDFLSGFSISGGGNLLNGSYGSAGDTSLLDNEADGTNATRYVGLRFTVSLRTSDANSPLVMNGTDGLPTYEEATSPTAWPEQNVGYAGLERIAGTHPAVMVGTTQLSLTAANEEATSSGNGVLGGGVS